MLFAENSFKESYSQIPLTNGRHPTIPKYIFGGPTAVGFQSGYSDPVIHLLSIHRLRKEGRKEGRKVK